MVLSPAWRGGPGQGSSSVEADRSAGGGGRGPAQHSAVDVLLLDVKGQEGEGCFINGLVVYKVNTGVAAASEYHLQTEFSCCCCPSIHDIFTILNLRGRDNYPKFIVIINYLLIISLIHYT